MLARLLLTAAVLSALWLPALSFVIAKSTINACTVQSDESDIETLCEKKLVVAMTVTANEGASQKIEATIAKAIDTTGEYLKNVQLQKPFRIIINKSPVIINYRLFQVGYVSNYPHETIRRKKLDTCREDWYATDAEITCPFKKTSENEKVFDSQGFCCECIMNGKEYSRGAPLFCGGITRDFIGHCLVFDDYNYYVFGLYPPVLQFTIAITIQRRSYLRTDESDVWEDVTTLQIGPHKRVARSNAYKVKAEYIADFNPSEFVRTETLSTRYLLVPDDSIFKRYTLSNISTIMLSVLQPILSIAGVSETHLLPSVYHNQRNEEKVAFINSLRNVSEWMAVPKTMFDLTRTSCNKIGVGYSAFRHQESKCTARLGSCLLNQPFLLWKKEKTALSKKMPGKFMLHNFGKVHSLPHTKDVTNYQVNFIANKPSKSLIVITMVADNIRILVSKSPARIVEAYIESFEALVTTGSLIVVVQNIGSYSATYNVFVVHCSAGIDIVTSLSVTLDPNQISNASFVMHSFNALGKMNYCTLELNDVDGDLLDNMTIAFETLDTCFCYGFCGCACGAGNTTCPQAPKMDEGDRPYIQNAFPPDWLVFLGKAVGPSVLIMFWIFITLYCLGSLKILHMLLTGDFGVPEPVTIALAIAKEILMTLLNEWFPRCIQACMVCCEKSVSCCVVRVTCCLSLGQQQQDRVITKTVGLGWRVPKNCNGMCKGAKFTRQRHRKLMRVNKRKGMKNETAWYQKPYKCSCKVKDNMPCFDIIKGMFFFHYCLFLPLFWLLHYMYGFCKRKWKRHKRKKRFRQSRAERLKEEDQAYLQLDKYSRGKVEREILDLNQEIKANKKMALIKQSEGFNPDEEDIIALEPTSDRPHGGVDPGSASSEDDNKVYASSAYESSDTSDADEARDIDELLIPGNPVYFNYAIPEAFPPSIQHPCEKLSVQGRLRQSEKENDIYIFDLYKYTYQVKEVREKKIKLLDPPKLLTDSREFEHRLDRKKALQLVTFVPLFPCLNDTTTFVMKMQSRKTSVSLAAS